MWGVPKDKGRGSNPSISGDLPAGLGIDVGVLRKNGGKVAVFAVLGLRTLSQFFSCSNIGGHFFLAVIHTFPTKKSTKSIIFAILGTPCTLIVKIWNLLTKKNNKPENNKKLTKSLVSGENLVQNAEFF